MLQTNALSQRIQTFGLDPVYRKEHEIPSVLGQLPGNVMKST